MHLARKLVLLAVTAVAAMALSAAAASAVTVTNEAGDHCPAVVPASHGAGSGGCVINASSEGTIRLENPFGGSLCTNNFTGRVDETGAGYITNQTLGGSGCNLVPCAESGVKDVWPANLTSETAMEADFCVTAFGFLTVQCHLPNVQVHIIDHTQAEFATIGDQDCENPNFGVEGHWSASSPDGVEIVH
jgi:hypothetical protein